MNAENCYLEETRQSIKVSEASAVQFVDLTAENMKVMSDVMKNAETEGNITLMIEMDQVLKYLRSQLRNQLTVLQALHLMRFTISSDTFKGMHPVDFTAGVDCLLSTKISFQNAILIGNKDAENRTYEHWRPATHKVVIEARNINRELYEKWAEALAIPVVKQKTEINETV